MNEAPWPDYLFDIGNVILFFDYQRFAQAIAQECGCTAEELLRILEEDRDQMEGRSLSSGEFLDLAFAQIGYRGTRKRFVRAWQEIFAPNEPMIDFIHELADRGHRLFLLSNTNQLHADYFLREYPVFARFQGHVFSHEAGCAKPDPRIYALAIETLGLIPERTVYLDDLAANVEAGAAFGFHAVRYERQAVREFDPERMRRRAGVWSAGPSQGR